MHGTTFKVRSVHCALYKDHVKIMPVQKTFAAVAVGSLQNFLGVNVKVAFSELG
jgi:hypothetical protein